MEFDLRQGQEETVQLNIPVHIPDMHMQIMPDMQAVPDQAAMHMPIMQQPQNIMQHATADEDMQSKEFHDAINALVKEMEGGTGPKGGRPNKEKAQR